jgi:hypothetical protein
MTNKDLLKEAIAEATTIREAAIANAKEALEESITPHLREMLAQKLQEMDELEETDNNGTDSQVDGEGDDIDHGNIVNEDEDEDTEEEGPEEETEETEKEEEDEEFDLENMSKEEFEAAVKDIVAQVNGEMETPGEEDLEGMEDDNTIDIDSEDGDSMDEINIDELLAELDELNEGDGLGTPKEIPGKPTHSYSKKPGSKRSDSKGTPGDGYMEEEVDLDEYTSSGGGWGGGSSAGSFSLKPGEKDEGDLNKWIAAIAAKTGQSIQSLTKKIMGTSDSTTAPRKSNAPRETSWEESVQNKADLQEALKAVKTLRNQLQEVNLLNAKLLYVNKVFKSNNLSEGQKVNVIAAFDKAETVKEVKLVFETVSKNVVVKKPTTVKEHRSFASKATGMTAAPKKEIISEVSEQVLRMQKLAGIIK